MTHWALLGSPFLGPEVWTPAAEALGPEVSVVAGRGDSAEEVLGSFRRGLPDTADLVLVPHSNAGLYAAALAAAPGVEGIVFVDALLPGPEATTPVTSPELSDHLTSIADEHGALPPWTSWWPSDDVAPLFPSDEVRRVVEAGQPRVAAAYLADRVPTPAGWRDLPCAYLAFGPAYAEERASAEAWGWPVVTLDGGHLHPLVAPGGVAVAVAELWERAHVPD